MSQVFEVYGFIGPEMVDRFRAFAAQEPDSIELRIDSPGGSIRCAESMISMIMSQCNDCQAYVRGVCASASHYIALACSRIAASRKSSFYLHNSYFERGITGDQFELANALAELSQTDERFVAMLHHRTKQPVSVIEKWMSGNRSFNATEALRLCFIDGLREDISSCYPVGSRFWNWNPHTRRPIGPSFATYEAAAHQATAKRCPVVQSPPRFDGHFRLVAKWDESQNSLVALG